MRQPYPIHWPQRDGDRAPRLVPYAGKEAKAFPHTMRIPLRAAGATWKDDTSWSSNNFRRSWR